MNITEGMRRVGIVLGVLGAAAGGFDGYQHISEAWAAHTRFDQLRALPVVRDAASAIRVYPRDSKGCSAPGDKLVVCYGTLTTRQTTVSSDVSKAQPVNRAVARANKAAPSIPDKIVEIPGLGNVAFPNSMSDDQISAVIKRHEGFSTTGQPTAARSSPG